MNQTLFNSNVLICFRNSGPEVMVDIRRHRRLDPEDTKDILQMTGGQMEDQRLVFIILSEPNPP